MSQKNETPILFLTLTITLLLLGGGTWWANRRFNLLVRLNVGGSGTDNAPESVTPVGSRRFSEVADVPSGLFNYGGSTTWAPLRQQVDSAIQAVHPQFRLRYLNPTTGEPGSGKGIEMLIDNQLSFVQTSRSLQEEEYRQAQARGFSLKEVPVAIDAIAVGVHPDLNLPGLTLYQLKGIYTGQITNWAQVGGPNVPISPYARPAEAGGTIEFFAETILQGEAFSPDVRYFSTTTEALRAVAVNLGSIYFASAPELVPQCSVQPLPIGLEAGAWVAPYRDSRVLPSQCPDRRNQVNTAAFQSGQYPITRRLFVVIKQNGELDQLAGRAYVNLLLTEEGQQAIEAAGFVRIR